MVKRRFSKPKPVTDSNEEASERRVQVALSHLTESPHGTLITDVLKFLLSPRPRGAANHRTSRVVEKHLLLNLARTQRYAAYLWSTPEYQASLERSSRNVNAGRLLRMRVKAGKAPKPRFDSDNLAMQIEAIRTPRQLRAKLRNIGTAQARIIPLIHPFGKSKLVTHGYPWKEEDRRIKSMAQDPDQIRPDSDIKVRDQIPPDHDLKIIYPNEIKEAIRRFKAGERPK